MLRARVRVPIRGKRVREGGAVLYLLGVGVAILHVRGACVAILRAVVAIVEGAGVWYCVRKGLVGIAVRPRQVLLLVARSLERRLEVVRVVVAWRHIRSGIVKGLVLGACVMKKANIVCKTRMRNKLALCVVC